MDILKSSRNTAGAEDTSVHPYLHLLLDIMCKYVLRFAIQELYFSAIQIADNMGNKRIYQLMQGDAGTW